MKKKPLKKPVKPASILKQVAEEKAARKPSSKYAAVMSRISAMEKVGQSASCSGMGNDEAASNRLRAAMYRAGVFGKAPGGMRYSIRQGTGTSLRVILVPR